MKNALHRPLLSALTLALGLLAGTASAQAPAPTKSVAVEHAPVFPAFERWVSTVWTAPTEAAPTQPRFLPLVLSAAPAANTYQPQPVILGLPELPLVGEGASQIGAAWSPNFNYQGVSLRQVVLDASGRRLESRSMARGLRAGERFKIRVTASFDSVAEVDQVIGDAWYGQRTGQVYPQPGMSVEVRAGQTVDLPLDPNEYFVIDRPSNERLVVSVRHARASGEARSAQPAYRQDGNASSLYLQLVPLGQYPAIEQLISHGR